uniref:dTMP kinase n=1 Tax=Graphocephala atropunctata TaxID=36148 RepID=A0A1B6LJ93_9HEMI
MKNLRGALIVIEGCDRSGKTTQCKKIVASLKSTSIPAEYMNFPDRSTAIGKIINGYLTKREEICDEAIHLLFSANRWELVSKIRSLLQQGTTVVVDRYCYSGVAFSSIKTEVLHCSAISVNILF